MTTVEWALVLLIVFMLRRVVISIAEILYPLKTTNWKLRTLQKRMDFLYSRLSKHGTKSYYFVEYLTSAIVIFGELYIIYALLKALNVF